MKVTRGIGIGFGVAIGLGAAGLLTVDEAKGLLDDLVLRGIARMHVSERGVLVYVFAEQAPDADRARRG